MTPTSQRPQAGSVLVVNADGAEGLAVAALIRMAGFSVEVLPDVAGLNQRLQGGECMAALVDLDATGVDNRTIRDLAAAHSSTSFFCMSARTFHPELSDAIGRHFYACLTKPVDPDELAYWLRCVAEK